MATRGMIIMYKIFGTHIKEEKIVRPGTDQTRQGGIRPTRHTSPGKCDPYVVLHQTFLMIISFDTKIR